MGWMMQYVQAFKKVVYCHDNPLDRLERSGDVEKHLVRRFLELKISGASDHSASRLMKSVHQMSTGSCPVRE